MKRCSDILATTGALLAATALHAGDICGTWEVEPTPNPHPTLNVFEDAVEMPGGSAVALGFGFILQWNGNGWDDIPYADYRNIGNGNGRLSGIGSTPNGDIWGVGIIGSGEPFLSHALVGRWRGGEWDILEPVPISPEVVWPFGPRSAHASCVAGAGPDDVWVSGRADGSGSGQGGSGQILMLHWDGSEWTEHFPPTPGGLQNEVVKLAAVASDDVWAVGMLQRPGVQPLILHWDGTSWNNDPHPGQFMGFAQIYDIAVVAADDIWVVGHGDDSAPLFMHWNGVEWIVVDPPADATSIVAQRVVAIATDDVWAVSADRAEYYHWDGVSWSTVPAPSYPGVDQVDRGPGMVAVGTCDVLSFGALWTGNDPVTLVERLRPSVGGVEGDATGDGVVDFADIIALLAAWGACGECPEDLDGDGAVTFADLLIVLANWT